MTETTEKRNYKSTLNLPATSFPMRANLAQNEPASLKRWDDEELYAGILRDRADADPFVFHDGPPYANGSIHAGHLLNKVLKDFVVRFRLLEGRNCRYVPGWDCHGLPIEHKVMGELNASGKLAKIDALSDDQRRMAIRRECRKDAEKYVKLQSQQMRRLLTCAEYDDPYLTMAPAYERAVLEVFADLVEQGLVTRALKPVHWSIVNRTALAEAELEYEDREDLSIYVDFEFADRAAVAAAFGVELDETASAMIWTTTPWTLPANLAIAVHERYRYALVRLGGGFTVVATDRVAAVAAAAGLDPHEILAECDGRDLVGLAFRHPFCDRTGPIVGADYVTLEDGTGLVHTAPGHGTEDYLTGLREGLDIYCPVRDDGTYDDTVPEWLRGMSVWDANDKVVEHLRASGHLLYAHAFVHSYPHDWRSRTPVIFRCTEQWFVTVDTPMRRDGRTLRDAGLAAIENDVAFYPEWGRNRFRGMVESRPDWCISRQRAWGLPIPAFQTPDGRVVLTSAMVRAVAHAFGERGSDAWFTEPPADLLATWDASADAEAPAGVDVATLEKCYDIFDVWFESGSSWNAVMRERGIGFPIDLYLEGSDQHRGWFQLSLLPSIGATGEAPFRSILTHGFVVDRDGRKMSKSGGNALSVDEVLQANGADVCRWCIASLAFENDVRLDEEYFTVSGDSYRKVRNTLRFLLGNLKDFTPCTPDNPHGMCVELASLPPTSIDAWVLGRAGVLYREVRAAYDRYEFRRVYQMVYDFCNDTLSSVYCAAVKDRLYCDRADSPRRRATQTVLWDLLEMLTRLLAPIVPHTADEAYRALWNDESRSVHRQVFVAPPDSTADPEWPRVMAARQAALKALEGAKAGGVENPLDAEVVLPDPDGVLERFAADLPDLLGVSRVRCDRGAAEPAIVDLRDEPRCERSWRRDGTVRLRSDGGMLSDRDADAVGTT